MITISKNAAEQIKFSATQSGISNAVMRIAIRKMKDGSLHYALGFDDAITELDIQLESQGIKLVVSPESLNYGQDLTVDFVELDNGEKNFIFINPADPNCSAAPNLVS